MLILSLLSLSLVEPFLYSGPHAASHGPMSTVWWDDMWDATQESVFLSQVGTGHHIDIHKAHSHILTDGSLTSESNKKFGDGGLGVGVHHLNYHGVVSSRLRIPAKKPTHIDFYANKDVNTAHWWELVFTPDIVGAENTAIPSQTSIIPALPRKGPFSAMGAVPGPGRTPYVPSVNIIYAGRSDIPCNVGFQGRLAVRDASKGGDAVTHSSYYPHDIAYSSDVLWHFYVTLDDAITVSIDKDDDGFIDWSETFPVEIPWETFYVHLTSVAYQADHHPQGNCFEANQTRELKWRNFKIDGLAFEGVDVWPKEEVGERELISLGAQAFDLRDTQRRGMGTFGKQPNEGFLKNSNGILCKGAAWACGGYAEKSFRVSLPKNTYKKAFFVYSIKGFCDAKIHLNNVMYNLDDASSIPNHGGGWVRRSVEVWDVGMENVLEIQKTGRCFLENISLEAYF